MPDNHERACLFCIDGQSGKRKRVENILPNSVIGFMNATPWCGKTRDHRRTNAMERINQFLSAINQKLPPELICSYASPEDIDVEDKWTRIAKSKELELYQKKFVETHLLPLVSSNETGKPIRLNVDEAKRNMRLTLVGFSYGGMFIAGVRKALMRQMQGLGYDDNEIKDIFSQVYQINFGVQRCDEDKIEPRFNELNIVTYDDNQGIWESWVDQPRNFVMLKNRSEVTRADGKRMTKPHSQEIYAHAIANKPALCDDIAKNLVENSPLPAEYMNTPEDQQVINNRLAEISYRMQMLRRD